MNDATITNQTRPAGTDALPDRDSATPAWRIGVAGVAIIGVTFGFARYGYGLFAPRLRAEFGLSMGVVGLIGSATYVGYVLALVTVAAWSRRLGPRAMVVAGGVASTVGLTTVALAHDTVVLVAGLVLAGTSSGWAWAPLSDAVDRMVAPSGRERVMGLIPSGTAFGVVAVGLAALAWADDQWRWAWVCFAAVSAVVTAFNALVLVGHGRAERGSLPRPARFLRRAAVPLHLTAVSYGLVGAVYWTFAASAVSAGGVVAVFWTVMGAAGTLGVAAGVVIGRLGLRVTHAYVFASLGLAVALLAIAPGSTVAVMASAILYGPAFMAGSSVLAVWSYQRFPDHPAGGFSVTLLAVGVGTIAGPALLGAVAERGGLAGVFAVTAAIAAATLLVAPRRAGH
ncbi:YbfB/YjiJ family MFS transporter [Stackebrandtia sp.]|uniref:YbfB/YjiJ family MFS transporter n=1 Tax=Stackebrandtia sp. TaxID=2023065 RepID=UPI002D7908FC|nr:YbfB/YjiJ family MFS transporter [Stackebrandtia sp.]